MPIEYLSIYQLRVLKDTPPQLSLVYTVPLKSKLPPSRETRIASRETRLSSLETRLSSLETRLERRDFRLERRESRLARALKNWKYGCLNFSWDFSSLMLTVQQQRSKTYAIWRSFYCERRRPELFTTFMLKSCNSWKSQIFVAWEWFLWICCKFLSFKSKTYRLSLPQCV